VSGIEKPFHSLQVTFFGIRQSDCIKKILQAKKKKRFEAKLTTSI